MPANGTEYQRLYMKRYRAIRKTRIIQEKGYKCVSCDNYAICLSRDDVGKICGDFIRHEEGEKVV